MSSDHGVGMSAAATEHDQLKQLGKYEIQRKLGAGGMGTVFLAIDQDLRRTVALKVLPRDRAENAILVRRFKAEAQAAAQLHHKNIVGVYEAGQADGLLYIALEYIDGADALHLIQHRGVLPVKRSIEIVRGVAEALQHAFEKNIVHRDIKPSNLMIAKDGEVKLADMGLARSIDETLDTSITRAGTTVGTVDYMAPEQARNSKAADIRSDLYSLGCTWFHLLTGEPPFGDGDVMAKVQAHALKSPPDPRRLNDRIPDAIVAVIQRLMAKKPQDRYQTPRDLVEELSNPNLHRQGVTSDILASLGKAHIDEPDEAEAEFEETDGGAAAVTNGGGRSGKSPKTAASSSKKASSSGTRPSAGKGTKRPAAENVESLIGQALDEEDQAEKKANRKKSSGDRALPDRMDAQKVDAGFTQMSIDPAFFQIGLVVLLIGTVVGAIAWVLRSGASSSVEDKGNLAAIVQRNNDLNAQPAAPMPMPAAVTPMPAPVTPDPVVPSVATIKYTGPQDASPFPGMPDSSPQASLLPAWVPYTRGPAPDDVAVVKVRRFRTEPGEIAAVAQVGNRDRVVLEFLDEGPHAIPASALGKIKWLGLRGRNVRPALVVSGAPDGNGAVFGGVRGGSLKIEGIDLHWNVPEGIPAALFGCQGGEILVRNSTIAIIGAGDASAAAIQLKGVAGTVTRGVIENVILRNEAGGGIQTEGPGVEFVAGNLLSLTRGTVLKIGPAALTTPPQLPATRVGRFFQSTLVTAEGLFAARHEGNVAPAGVDLRFDRTLAIHRGEPAVPAIVLSSWPDCPPEDAEAARPQGFKLQGEALQLAGWGTLTQPSSGSPVPDGIGWRLFWRHQAPSENFVAATPAAVAGWTRSFGSLPMDALSADLKGAAIQALEGSPGAKYGELPSPPEGLAENIAAFSDRPQIPTVVSRSIEGGEVRFDLKKSATFNRFLNSECPDNARVIAFGAGLKLIDPVVLKKKSITIVFEQTDGAPLEIQPQSKGGSGNEKNAPEAFFSVSEGARLELINGRFEVLFTKGKPYPKRLAQVSESSLVLTNCTIEGSQSPDAPAQSLVQIISGPMAGGSGATSFLVCRRSFLRGKGPLVEIAAPRVHSRFENSLLISGREGIAFEGDTSKGIVDLDSVTLSTAGAALRTAADNSGDLRLFVSESLVVPPGAGTASLVLDEGNGAGKRIAWWGVANAYSSKLADFVVGEGHPAGKQDFERDWVGIWGQGHDLRPASGEEAVLLTAPLGKLTDLKPDAFTLKSGCLAAIWDERGGPVGADVAGIGAPEAGKSNPMAKPMPMPMPGTPKKPGTGF